MICLDNAAFEQIDPDILVTDFREKIPEEDISSGECVLPYGSLTFRRKRKALSVELDFVILSKSPLARQQVLEKIHH